MNPKKFFAELQRRNVYKVAVAYGVVSWLLIQITAQVFPVFEIPAWAIRLIVLTLAVGFPVALVLAWAYELTPEGVKRTEEIDPKQSITRSTSRKLDFVIIGVLLAVIAVLAFQRFRAGESPLPDISEKSIAVLPFENRSEEKANAYFADGIQDEILTRLSKISDLKVISRSSTQHYKSAPQNIRVIARELGVAHLLAGSVQKSGDAVRINVQLIKAESDSHLWAETFDRKLIDIFSVESEIAKSIADQLRARLTGREEQIIAAEPTNNLQAYDAYLRGLAYTTKAGTSTANALAAQKHLREAVQLDPQFALAWALLSNVDSLSYLSLALQPTIALRDEAQQAADTAVRLQPTLGEALHAKGFYHYACLRDYDTAVHYFEQARALLPNSSRIPRSLGLVARRRGDWDLSQSYFTQALQLDPRNVGLLNQVAISFILRRRFPEALSRLDQVLALTPDDPDILAEKAAIAQAQGDLPRAASILAPLHPGAENASTLETQVYQAILERRPAPIIPRLKEILAKPDPALGHLNGEIRFWLGWAQDIAGERAAAQESWRQARSELEPLLEEQPQNHVLMCNLALTYLALGDKPAALAMTQRAEKVTALAMDAVIGPLPTEILARIAASTGDVEGALSILEKLLKTPYDGPVASGIPITPDLLRLDPMFDPLRHDARFQKLAGAGR